MKAFLDAITEQEDILELQARVDIASIPGSRRDRADELVREIWKYRSYRFVYHSQYPHKRTDLTRFMYHCAHISARQHAPKKNQREGAKSGDKIAMESFPCKGWFHITVTDGDNIAWFVHENHKLTLGQLWDEILEKIPIPPFTRKVIHSMWSEINSKEWKRDIDEVKSAKIILEEFGNSHCVPAPCRPRCGYDDVAWATPGYVRRWG
ncbi:hypothetical protein FB451DRAFT_1387091 [Mycena latifolia]|nr:hypothetical protein FB451DRAFT_1387091 [Mycena latifolia]